MAENLRQDWGGLYEAIGDGIMPGCKGVECPASCCGPKHGFGGEVDYRTILLDEDEVLFQNSIPPSIESLDIDVIALRPDVPIINVETKKRISAVYVVDKCCEGGCKCKMEGRKPFICRIFPMGIYAKEPLIRGCPAAVEIFCDKKIRDRVMHVRSLMGFRDNEQWLAAGLRKVEQIKLKRHCD